MSTPATDQNLLFGVLALQADCLTPGQFVEACSLWATQKTVPLADLLVQRGWLTTDDRADVERLLQRKLTKHTGDAYAGLAEVTTDEVRHTLAGIADPDVRESMAPPAGPDSLLVSTISLVEGDRDRYTITRLHATGGIGRVWLARDGALGRDVALKELRPDRSQPALSARFLKEARITGQLEHPGIVPVYELGHRPEDNQPFYTMRFVRGRTLREAIRAYHQKREQNTAGPLDFRDLLTAFVGVCNAVAYAHSRGVIHRDLKPANVVLGDYGEVMVLDWGLAKVVADGPEDEAAEPRLKEEPLAEGENPTLQGQVLGTPAYMAPEQADGRLDHIDARTDIYGLGAVLYELLTNRPPFDGSSTADVLNHVRHLAPARPRNVVPTTPLPLEAVCLKALQKRSQDRYATTKELAADVQRFLADEPVAAYREPLLVRSRRWARRHRTLVSSGVVALVVAVPILLAGIVLLERAGEREHDARERAQANYNRALKSGDLMAGELARGVRPLAGTQRKTVLAILDRAGGVYDDLLSDPAPPREALEGQARTLVLFAELYRESNQTIRGIEAATRAIAVYDRLLTEYPGDVPNRIGRATARHRLAWVHYDQGHDTKALEEFQACIHELEECRAQDDPSLAATTLASAYTFSANIYFSMGDHAEARKRYEKGFALRQQGRAANTTDAAIRSGLGISLEKYGAFLVAVGEREKGLEMMRQAPKELEALTRAEPWNTELSLHWIRSLNTLAQTVKDPGEQKRHLDAAQAIADRFARVDPDHIIWQREAYRQEHLRKELELSTAVALTREEKIKLYRSQLDLNERIIAITVARNREDPDNYLWLADTANLEARSAESCVRLLAIAYGPDELLKLYLSCIFMPSGPALLVENHDALMKLARTRVASSIAHYELALKRSPDDQTWWAGKIYALWVASHVETAHDNTAASYVAHWKYLAETIAHRQEVVARYPTDVVWRDEMKRNYITFLFGFTPAGLTKEWPKVAGDPAVVDALLQCCRAVASQPANFPDDLRESNAIARRTTSKYLKELDAQGKLSPEGRELLQKLQ